MNFNSTIKKQQHTGCCWPWWKMTIWIQAEAVTDKGGHEANHEGGTGQRRMGERKEWCWNCSPGRAAACGCEWECGRRWRSEVWRMRWGGSGGLEVLVEVQGEHSHSRLDHGSWEIMEKKSYRIPWRDLMHETPFWNRILVMHKKSPTSTFLLLWHKILSVDSFLPFNWLVKNGD